MSAEYRRGFLFLVQLAATHTQRIFLSGTLPPTSMHNFMETACLSSQFTRIVRGLTNRPEIRYHTVRVNAKERNIHSVVVKLATGLQAHLQEDSRGIIFASTVADAKEVAAALGAFQHHSEMSATARQANMTRWKEGVALNEAGTMKIQSWMVATPGLMYGIDLKNIGAVIFDEEGMTGLVGGVQGTARGGRAGQPCMCFFVTTGTFNPKVNAGDFTCIKKMAEWTRLDKCLRVTPSEVIDGHTITCEILQVSNQHTEYCGFCRPHTKMTALIKNAIATADKPSNKTNTSCLAGYEDLPEDCFAGPVPSEAFASQDTHLSTFAPSKGVAGRTRTQGPHPPIEKFVAPPAPPPSSAPPAVHREKDNSNDVRSLRGHASMPIIMNATLATSLNQTKFLKTAVLDRLILRVRMYCYSCYILTGNYKPRDHERIIQCSPKATFGMGWMSFKKSWINSFPSWHFCRSCGIPQDVGWVPFGPASHPVYGKGCVVEDMIPTMLFALKRDPQAWIKVAASAKLPVSMTDEEFADWVKSYSLGTANYYNGLELVIWFVTEVLKHDKLRPDGPDT
jgi:hypothetical protein